MPPKRGHRSSEESSMIKKIKMVRGGEDEQVVHGGEKFICNDCGEILETARKLKSHHRKHKTFVCEKCNNSLSLRNKQRHIKVWKGGNTMKRCDECDFETKYQCLLDKHKKKHSSFVCDDFCEILTSRQKLDKHKVHPVRYYECEDCELKRTNSFQLCQNKKQFNCFQTVTS